MEKAKHDSSTLIIWKQGTLGIIEEDKCSVWDKAEKASSHFSRSFWSTETTGDKLPKFLMDLSMLSEILCGPPLVFHSSRHLKEMPIIFFKIHFY